MSKKTDVFGSCVFAGLAALCLIVGFVVLTPSLEARAIGGSGPTPKADDKIVECLVDSWRNVRNGCCSSDPELARWDYQNCQLVDGVWSWVTVFPEDTCFTAC